MLFRSAKSTALLSEISDNIMAVLDSDSSVWATGLTEGIVNSLRTRMYRRDVQITVRLATRNGERGRIITGRRIKPGERA